MLRTEINWGPGRVTYWSLDFLDEAIPLREQVAYLQEDLAQVEYPGKILLDVGWYPDCSVDGQFVVVVVRAFEWDRPYFEEACKAVQRLRESLARAVLQAESAMEHPG